MVFKADSTDHAELKHILGNGVYDKPNYSHWVYKNRSGLNHCIIWTKMNLGTIREEPLFVTDTDFNLLDVSPLEIMFDNTETESNSKDLPKEQENYYGSYEDYNSYNSYDEALDNIPQELDF